MSDVDSFWRKRVEREEAEIANRLAQMQSGLSRHFVSKTSFNVMGVPQIIRRAGAGSRGGRVAKSEVLRVNHVEAAPAFDNPFMSSASEAGGGAARLERAAAGDMDATAAAAAALRLRGAGASRASSTASSMDLPPFNEFTTPPSPSIAPSTFSYPATPNFSEGGTSAVDPDLLERLERLEMALVEEKKARANVEQRLQKIKEEEEEKKSSAGVSGTAKSAKMRLQRLGTTAVATQRGGGRVSSALASGTTAPRAASKPSSRAASSVVKKGSFR